MIELQLGAIEDASIAFFPNSPGCEAGNEAPNPVKDVVVEMIMSPIVEGVTDGACILVRFHEYAGRIVPKYGCKWTVVEQGVHVFSLGFTQATSRWAYEASMKQLVPGQYSSMV